MEPTYSDNVTARHPLHESKKFGVPSLERERAMKEWVLVPASQSDEWERLVDQALG